MKTLSLQTRHAQDILLRSPVHSFIPSTWHNHIRGEHKVLEK